MKKKLVSIILIAALLLPYTPVFAAEANNYGEIEQSQDKENFDINEENSENAQSQDSEVTEPENNDNETPVEPPEEENIFEDEIEPEKDLAKPEQTIPISRERLPSLFELSIKTFIFYDEIIVTNNVGRHDTILFKGINYIDDTGEQFYCTINIFLDKNLSDLLYTTEVSSYFLDNRDYQINIPQISEEPGTLYIQFQYDGKEPSDIIEVDYDGEKISRTINIEDVEILNTFNTSYVLQATVHNIQSDDLISFYSLTNGNYKLLGSCKGMGDGNSAYTTFAITADITHLYISRTAETALESEKIEIEIPDVLTTSYGAADSDIPSPEFIIQNNLGSDNLIIDGLANNTIVTVYTSETKQTKLATTTIHVSGTIPLKNVSSYDELFISLKAADKYESNLISIPVSQANISKMEYDAIEVFNGISSDELRLYKLKYTDESLKNTAVTVTVYGDADLTTPLYTANIAYTYTQGTNDYTLNIGNKLANESGTVYITFKYATRLVSEPIPIEYEAYKTTPEFSDNSVTVETKYNGVNTIVYITATGLEKSTTINAYKLLQNGTYSRVATGTSGTGNTAELSFAYTSDVDVVYVSKQNSNWYESEKTSYAVLLPGMTTFGTEGSDYPDAYFTSQNMNGSGDYVLVYNAGIGAQLTIYKDINKTTKLGSNTLTNINGSVAIANIRNYEQLYVTLRAPDKYESEIIALTPNAPNVTLIAYDNMYITNRVNGAKPRISFEKLTYTDSMDSRLNVTIKIYSDPEKTDMLAQTTITYASMNTALYEFDFNATLNPDGGTVYVTFTVPTKQESEVIPLEYSGGIESNPSVPSEKINMSSIYNGTIATATVTVKDLLLNDVVNVYYQLPDNTFELLGTASARNFMASIVFTIPEDVDTVYVTLNNPGLWESDKTPISIPEILTTTIGKPDSDFENPVVVVKNRNNSNDILQVSELKTGTQVQVYSNESLTTRIANATINSSGNISISNIKQYDNLYITFRAANKYPSESIKVNIPEVEKTIMDYDSIRVLNNVDTDKVLISKLKYIDELDKALAVTITVYSDEEKSTIISSANIASSYAQGTNDYTLTMGNKLNEQGGKVYITFKYASKFESDVIPIEYSAHQKTLLDYNSIKVENNANANDYIYIENLKYTDEADKNLAVTLTIYGDEALTSQLYTANIASTYTQGTNTYSASIGNKLPSEAGTVYITFKYGTKLVSDVIPIEYGGQRTSPVIEPEQVAIETKYNGTNSIAYITISDLEASDTVYIYKLVNGTFTRLTTVSTGNNTYTTTSFTRTVDAETIYVALLRKNQFESEKTSFDVPVAKTTNIGEPDSDFPNPIVIARDRTGSDIIEISGVAQGTQVFVYTTPEKTTRIATGTINTSGSIAVNNLKNYETIYVTLRATDKLESEVIPVTPLSAVQTVMQYNSIRVENNANANDYIYIENLKYTDEADKNLAVTLTIYGDEALTSQLYTANIASTYTQGTNTYSASIGNKLPSEAGTVYITFKYGTKLVSDVIAVEYGGQKTSPAIEPEQVAIETKYNGTNSIAYITISELEASDTVYIYKLVNGVYTRLATASTGNNTYAATSFTRAVDAETVYVSLLRKNQFESEKTSFDVPVAKTTNIGEPDSDFPNPIVIARDRTGSDIIEISGVAQGTQVFVYTTPEKTTRIATGTINTSGSIAVNNLKNYETIYVTLRATDKLESEVIPVTPLSAVQTVMQYNSIRVENNANANDYIYIENLKYTDEADKSLAVTLTIYGDEALTSQLYTANIASTYTQGANTYSASMGNKLPSEAGTVYVTFKYATKLSSDPIKIEYEAQKTSPVIHTDQTIVETRFNGATNTVYITVTDLEANDMLYIYRLLQNGTYSRITTASSGTGTTATGSFAWTADIDTVYLSLIRKNQFESEKEAFSVPYTQTTSFGSVSSDYPNPVIVAKDNAGLGDCLEIKGVGANTQVYVYTDASKTTRLALATINTEGTIAINKITQYTNLYITLRAPNKLESRPITVPVVTSGKTQLTHDAITIANNAKINDTIQFFGLEYVDPADIENPVTFTVYSDQQCTKAISTGTIPAGAISNNESRSYTTTVSGLSANGGQVYIRFKFANKYESNSIALSYKEEQASKAVPEELLNITRIAALNSTNHTVTIGFDGYNTGDIFRVYGSETGNDLLATIRYPNTGNITLSETVEEVYISLEETNRYEGLRTLFALPTPTTPLPVAGSITIINNAAAEPDIITYSGTMPAGSLLQVYKLIASEEIQEEYYELVANGVSEENYARIFLDVPSILGEKEGELYITVTFPEYLESGKVKASYAAEPYTSAIDRIVIDPEQLNKVTIYNIEDGDTVRVYEDAALTQLIDSLTASFLVDAVNTIEFILPTNLIGNTVYITNQNADKLESKAIVVPLALIDNNTPVRSTITGPSDVHSHTVTVDYSQDSSAIIAWVRTQGNSSVTVQITDSFGTVLLTRRISEYTDRGNTVPKQWLELRRPLGSQDVYTYTVTVWSDGYIDETEYVMRTGALSEAESLLGGEDHIIPLHRFISSYSVGWFNSNIPTRGVNYYTSRYIPNRTEDIFAFTNNMNTTITLMGNADNHLRFRIAESLEDVNEHNFIYDSHHDGNAMKTDWIANFRTVQKASPDDLWALQIGREYFLVVYTPEELQSSRDFQAEPSAYHLAVGEPYYMSDSIRVVSNTNVTHDGEAEYSDPVIIAVNNVPSTAVVKELIVGNIHSSQLNGFQVRNTTTDGLDGNRIVNPFFFRIEYFPVALGTANIDVMGQWEFRFRTFPSDAPHTFAPALSFNYIYEIGD